MKIVVCGGSAEGEQLQVCIGGVWENEGECVEPACEDGETRSAPCGEGGEKAQRCSDGEWVDDGACFEPRCEEGDARTLPCGEGDAGEQAQRCIDGEWVDEGACIECEDDARRLAFCATKPMWFQPQVCTAGTWKDEGACYEPACLEGETRVAPCAGDADLLQLQVCQGEMRWVDAGACFEAECSEGEERKIECGPASEEALRPRCVLGHWENGGACVCPEGRVYDSLVQGCAREIAGCDPEALPFGGGDGSTDSPYLICAPEHLWSVRPRSGQISHYVLAASLDLGGVEDFEPLGTLVGSFDGAGRALVGLTIAEDDGGDLALFAAIGEVSETEGAATGTVRDLVLRDFDVKGSGSVAALALFLGNDAHNVVEDVRLYGSTISTTTKTSKPAGGLIGHAHGGELRHNTVFADVSGFMDVGGMVGKTDAAALVNGTASGTVEGANRVGGLVGQAGARIEGCSASGSVVATEWQAGGLAGVARGAVSDSYATGDVSRGHPGTMDCRVGGLVGFSESTISRSHAHGDVVCEGFMTGGLVGLAGGSITHSSATGDVRGISMVGGLVGSTMRSAEVVSSNARGEVHGAGAVGGLVGYSNGKVVSSFATGEVSTTGGGGGLVGTALNDLLNSWSAGAVNRESSIPGGGLVHDVAATVVIDSCWTMSEMGGGASLLVHEGDSHFIEVFSSFALSQGDLPLVGTDGALLVDSQAITLADFAEAATFTDAGWDFETIWTMGSGAGIVAPDLRDNPRDAAP